MSITYPLRLTGSVALRGWNSLKASSYKFIVLFVVGAPFLGTVLAMRQLWDQAAGWKDVFLLIGLFVPIAWGVTVGYHRYFTHRSFTATTPLKLILGILGGMAIEGPVIVWVTKHLWHHAHSDTDEDIHSPRKGLWYAHVGWMFRGERLDPKQFPNSRKLTEDPVVVFINDRFWLWTAFSLLLPFLIGGWQGFLWGGLVRIFLVHHFTWGINSVCHTFVGQRPYRTPHKDDSSNVWWWVLAMGEQYHNTHHAFQLSARHGPYWFVDPSYCLIKVCEFLHLASNVIVPSKETLATKRIRIE